MDLRGGRTRVQALAALAVLGVLWAVAAFTTSSDAARLFRARTVGDHLGQPTDVLILELQAERRASTAWLAGSARGTGTNRPGTNRPGTNRPGAGEPAGQPGAGDLPPAEAALASQRARTDAAYATLRGSAGGSWVRWLAGDDAGGRVDALLDTGGRLADMRAAVDGRRQDRQHIAEGYTAIIGVAFRIRDMPRVWPDPALAERQDALLDSSRAVEVLAREDALVRGALAAGGLTGTDRERLAQLAGTRRFLHAEAEAALAPADLARHRRLVADPRFAALRTLEDRLVRAPAGDPPAATGEADWAGPADAVLAGLREVTSAGSREVVAAGTPRGVGTIAGAGLVGGLGFLALLAIAIARVRTPRTAGWAAALETAWAGHPARAPDGATETTTGTATTADTETTIDILATTGTATTADTEADLSALLLELNHRNQALLHRQLRVLESMQRRETDDEDLGDLFIADHLATRIRRNVEKVITLAGGTAGRRWRRPVPLVDVVRAAAAEVADYTRVAVSELAPASLAGGAVADVSHLLAELVDNATAVSGEQTRVRVTGAWCQDGYAIAVTDAGPGMAEDAQATARRLLAGEEPPSAGGTRCGLYTAGRLAARHGITVTVRNAPGEGLIAEVLLPLTLVVEATVEGDEPAQGTAGGGVPGATAGPAAGAAFGGAGGAPGAYGSGVADPGGPRTDTAGTASPPDDDGHPASGLPTRVRSATLVPTPTTGRFRRATAGQPMDRVARMRQRVEATTELPVTPGGPDRARCGRRGTVGRPGRESS